MGAVPPGDPSDAGTMMGPLISARQRDRVERYVQSAIDEGAKVVCGGKRPEGFDRGFFYEPTLITDVDNSMTVAQEEILDQFLSLFPLMMTMTLFVLQMIQSMGCQVQCSPEMTSERSVWRNE